MSSFLILLAFHYLYPNLSSYTPHLLIYFLRHPIKLKFNIYVATQYLKNMSHPKKVLISSQ